INALLAARLDLLEPREREALQRAAVIGREFWRGALGDDVAVEPLVRKELVRSEASALSGEEAFRLRHQLIRDAAYRSVPKERRAELHASFGAWLDERAPDRNDEIGRHLELAAGYRTELGEPDETLARRAAARLAAAGARADARADSSPAAHRPGRA